MTDYSTRISLSRDDMAEMLAEDDSGQTAYVLAELAAQFEPGTMSFDDFCDGLSGLEDTQKVILHRFCSIVADNLNPTA